MEWKYALTCTYALQIGPFGQDLGYMSKNNHSEFFVTAEQSDMAVGVFKQSNGEWGFRANVPGGKGKQVRTRGFPTMLAAYTARIKFLNDGIVMSPSSRGLTVAEWFARHLEVVRETLRPTTAENYQYAYERMTPYIGGFLLRDLNEDAIRFMYRDMAKTSATETLKTIHGRLKATLRSAVRERHMSVCPADNVTPPPGLPKRRKKTWSFEELMAFTAHVHGQRDRALWQAWVTTGARRGEMCGLTWNKIDWRNEEMTIDWQRTRTPKGLLIEGPTKTHQGTRIVPLTDHVVEALKEWRRDQAEQRLASGERWGGGDYVFTTLAGKPYHPDSFDDRLAILARAAGVPVISPHELRHTFASRCLEVGMDVKLVSAMLGHSKVETTMNLYQHVNPAVAKKEANMLAARMLG